MAWYKTGTINLTNGSATVYGNGTLWVDAAILNAGDVLIAPDGKLYEIGSFQSNTQLTLTTGYLGSTGAAQSYAIVPIGLLPSALAQQVKTTLSTANIALSQAVRFDATQNLTAPQQATARSNIGALAGADVGLGLLSKSVAGNVDVALTGIEAAALFYEFTGTLTGNISVIVPASVRQFYVRNATSGAYTLTIKTAAGVGIAILQGTRALLECDGTNVLVPVSLNAAAIVDAGGNVNINGVQSGNSYRLWLNGYPAFGNTGSGFDVMDLWSTNGVQFRLQAMGNSAASAIGNVGNHGFYFFTNNTERMRIDTSGNLLVGAASGNWNKIYKTTGESGAVLEVRGASTSGGVAIYAVNAAGENAASSAISSGKNSSTGRSINAAGTINASGADYAEYMSKAAGCGLISAGQIVGVDANGTLVDEWDRAVSFRVKSTNPSYVGGDTWGSEAALGMVRPTEPVFLAPEYEGIPHPGAAPAADAGDEERTVYSATLAAYEAAQKVYAEAVAAARTAFDTVTMPAYQVELAHFNEVIEQARQKVDRIAFCGQVPVNVTGAVPGQYVVPVQDGTGIGAALVNEADITFEQYRRAVGRVQNILPDGRANVVVKVV
jgi:hypothetical protein